MFFESILPLVGRHKRATKHAFLPDRTFASPWHNWAHFGETDLSSYLCLSRKRKSAGFSSFRVFGANYRKLSQKEFLVHLIERELDEAEKDYEKIMTAQAAEENADTDSQEPDDTEMEVDAQY